MSDDVRHVSPVPCPAWTVTPDELAEYFHAEYERMAPTFGYATREASAKPWADVPEGNRRLMTAVCASVLLKWFPQHAALVLTPDNEDYHEEV